MPIQIPVEKCVDVPKEICEKVAEKVRKEVCGDPEAVRSGEEFTARGLTKN